VKRPHNEDKASELRAETFGDAEKLVSQAKTVHALCSLRQHQWPEWNLDPKSTRLPKGFVVGPIRHDGFLDITEHCARGCGETRHYLARPSEVFGIGIRKTYRRPADRPVLARGISRGVWALPLQAAVQDRIMAAALKATEAANRTAARIEAKGTTAVTAKDTTEAAGA
jgi:hypothetical protein